MSEEADSTRPAVNRGQRRRDQRMNPLKKGLADPPPKQGGGLASLLGGGGARQAPYVPVLTSLDQIGLEPKVMEILIGEDATQCFVIPCQDLVYKEWQHMTKAKFAMEPQNEGEDDGE